VVFPVKPFNVLVNVPVPDASIVKEFEIVGLGVVLQQIPLAVTGELP
jgi:hypothetical protein